MTGKQAKQRTPTSYNSTEYMRVSAKTVQQGQAAAGHAATPSGPASPNGERQPMIHVLYKRNRALPGRDGIIIRQAGESSPTALQTTAPTRGHESHGAPTEHQNEAMSQQALRYSQPVRYFSRTHSRCQPIAAKRCLLVQHRQRPRCRRRPCGFQQKQALRRKYKQNQHPHCACNQYPH